jgi:hypothetical protein
MQHPMQMLKEIYRPGGERSTRLTKHKRTTKLGEISKCKNAEDCWDDDHRIQCNKTNRMQ